MPPARRAVAYLDLDVPVATARRARCSSRWCSPSCCRRPAIERDRPRARCRLRHRLFGGRAGAARRQVVALEEDAALARGATETLAEPAPAMSRVVTGPLAAGWAQGAPYDVILLEGARRGRAGCAARAAQGRRPAARRRRRADPWARRRSIARRGGHVTAQPLFDAAAPLLPGFAKPRRLRVLARDITAARGCCRMICRDCGALAPVPSFYPHATGARGFKPLTRRL